MLKCLEMVESYPQFDIPHLTSFGSHSELGCISVQGMEILHLLPLLRKFSYKQTCSLHQQASCSLLEYRIVFLNRYCV